VIDSINEATENEPQSATLMAFGPETPYFWPIVLTLCAVLVCLLIYIGWRLVARHRLRATQKSDGKTLARHVWKEWRRFNRRLRGDQRDLPCILVIGAGESQTAKLIDDRLGWRTSPDLAPLFAGSDGKAFFYAGTSCCVVELAHGVIASRDPNIHRVLHKIMRSLGPRLGTVVFALAASSLGHELSSDSSSDDFLGKASLFLQSVRKHALDRKIALRLCITGSEALAGYASLAGANVLQTSETIEVGRIDFDAPDGLKRALAQAFSAATIDFDLAARTLPANDFSDLLAFYANLPELAASLEFVTRRLSGEGFGDVALETISFAANAKAPTIGQPFAMTQDARERVRRFLYSRKIAQALISSALFCALMTGIHIEHLGLVRRANEQVQRLVSAPPLSKAFSAESEVTRAQDEYDAGQALRELFQSEILWTRWTAHERKHKLRGAYRRAIDEHRFYPVLRSESASASSKLAALGFLVAGGDVQLKSAMQRDPGYWAQIAGLPQKSAVDYLALAVSGLDGHLANLWAAPASLDLPAFSGDWESRLQELEVAFAAPSLDDNRILEIRAAFPENLVSDTREHFQAIAEVAGRLGQHAEVRTALADTVARGEMAGWVEENYDALARLIQIVHGQLPEDQVTPHSLAELRRRLATLAGAGQAPTPVMDIRPTLPDDENESTGEAQDQAIPTADESEIPRAAQHIIAPKREVLELHLGDRTYAFDVQRWRELTRSMAAKNLIARYLEWSNPDQTSPFLVVAARTSAAGQLRGSGQGSRVKLDGRFTRSHFRAIVAPAIAGLSQDLARWQATGLVDESSRVDLANHILEASDDYGRSYRQAYDDYCAGVSLHANTTSELYEQIDNLTYSKSWLIDFLAFVAEQTNLELDEADPFLAPIASALATYAPLHEIMAVDKGTYPGLAPFVAIYVDLIETMQGHVTAESETPLAKTSISAKMSALGAIALATLRRDRPDLRVSMRKLISTSHLSGEIGRILLDPIDRVYAFGRDELNHAIDVFWHNELLPSLKPIVLAFPFDREAAHAVAPETLSTVLGPTGTFGKDLHEKLGEVLAPTPNHPYHLLDGIREPSEFSETLEELDRLAHILWTEEGKERSIALGVTFMPLTKVELQGKSARLGFLKAGDARVVGFNERPSEKMLSIAWASSNAASLGLVFGSPKRSQVDEPISIVLDSEPFAFYRLLTRAQSLLAKRYRVAWSLTLPLPAPSASLVVEFDRDPWLDFALPITRRALGIGGK
jgi:hypothetical protein